MTACFIIILFILFAGLVALIENKKMNAHQEESGTIQELEIDALFPKQSIGVSECSDIVSNCTTDVPATYVPTTESVKEETIGFLVKVVPEMYKDDGEDEFDEFDDDDEFEDEYDVPYESYTDYLHSITPKTLKHEFVYARELTSTEKYFLRAISNKAVKNLDIARHWYYIYNLNIRATIAQLIGSGHLQVCNDISLERYTIPKLKDILIKKHLPKTGVKQVLIDRIWDNFTENELHDICGDDLMCYKLTEKGEDAVSSLARSATYNLELEDECIKLILDRRYNEAYRLVSDFRLESRIETGLNFDWSSSGIWNGKKLIGSNKKIKHYRACCIFCEMMGISAGKALVMYERLMGEKFDVDKEMSKLPARYYNFYDSNMRELKSYAECGIEKYRIATCLDARTCKKCAHMDGKVFNVADAVIGVNAPPFEYNCRCTTVAHFEKTDLSRLERSARDPETRQHYRVPGDMTYKEWSRQYFPERYKEYFCEEESESE